ncbi:uncharacterized protein LOC132731720 [Ruditapes philippinarum]|uniref:uncharacterized protein LOC132731720 n=1 Tax=Ruditapes philippinarum TaxID=129788 RepID=UPI00295B7A9B|nr:uncharacterized protein LOC132731720 [Ruditapes philippinarum]
MPKSDKKTNSNSTENSQQSANSSSKRTSRAKKHIENSDDSDIEVDLCKDCNSEIGNQDKALQCDLCENWFCYDCTQINSKIYSALNNSKNNGVLWICKHCRISMPGFHKLSKRLSVLEETSLKVEKKHKDFELKIKSLEDKLSQVLEKRPNEVINIQENVNGGSTGSISDVVNQVLNEQKDRESRRLNVICYGLPESVKESQEERKNDDNTRISSILSEIMNLSEVSFSETVRLGRYDGEKTRPTRFSVNSIETKQKILERARVNVRNSSVDLCKNLYFQSDLTLKQREEAYKLRCERRMKKNVNASQLAGNSGGTSSTSGFPFR